MKQRAILIFRCVSDTVYYRAHAVELSPAVRELVDFMRAHGTCSSWAWHAESPEAHAIALHLVRSSANEQPREMRRAA